MAVQASGADLAIVADIVAEFGGSAPHALSEYYGGAGLVPAGANGDVPTSGMIAMSDMYGTVAATVLTISSNTNNYDIGAAAISAGGDKNTPVILTINGGVTVGSSSTGTAAMYTGTGWGSGTTINITNNGSIVGASGSNTSGNPSSGGGSGGNGASPGTGNGGSNGGSGNGGSGPAESANNGGNAFEHSQTGDNNLAVVFDTAGTRTAGSAGQKTYTGNGGGGGGGGSAGGSACNAGGGGGGAASGSGGGGSGPGGSSGGATSGGSGGGTSGTCSGYSSAPANSPCDGHKTYRGSSGGGGGGGNLGNSGSGGGGGNATWNTCHNHASSGGPGGSGGSAGSNGTANGSAGSALAGNTGQIS
jgi:hypothetical protein